MWHVLDPLDGPRAEHLLRCGPRGPDDCEGRNTQRKDWEKYFHSCNSYLYGSAADKRHCTINRTTCQVSFSENLKRFRSSRTMAWSIASSIKFMVSSIVICLPPYEEPLACGCKGPSQCFCTGQVPCIWDCGSSLFLFCGLPQTNGHCELSPACTCRCTQPWS